MQTFLIVRDGDKWGVAQYAVDVTANNLPHYRVRHWYAEQYEAVNALHILEKNLRG